MTKRLPPLIPKLEQAVGLSGAAGLELDQMRNLFPEYSAVQVNNSANALAKQCRAYKSGKGRNSTNGIRWFLTPEWARAWAAKMEGQLVGIRTFAQQRATQDKINKACGYVPRPQSRKDAATTPNQELRRKMDEDRAALRASNRSGYVLTDEDKAKIVEIPGFTGRPKHAADLAEITGGFADLKPGRYAFPPASCAAQAVAA